MKPKDLSDAYELSILTMIMIVADIQHYCMPDLELNTLDQFSYSIFQQSHEVGVIIPISLMKNLRFKRCDLLRVKPPCYRIKLHRSRDFAQCCSLNT